MTCSCSPGHGTAIAPCWFGAALEKFIASSVAFMPVLMGPTCESRSTTTMMINGDQAYATLPNGGASYDSLSSAGGSLGKCHSSRGRQNASSATTAITATIAASKSASVGPPRAATFETTNCVPAKATPLTTTIGHTSSILRHPDITTTRKPGMMS